MCDDDGVVRGEYLKLVNSLGASSRGPFRCTGTAHLSGETFTCTSPAHTGVDVGSAKSLVADTRSHHIEGWVQNELVKIPLISEVDGNLWQGGCIPGARLPDDFRHVLSLFPWGKYELPDGCTRDEFTMYDTAREPVDAEVYRLARKANRMAESGRTLVHCQAGLNRSGLVTGLALVLRGMEPADAVALLRERRSPLVLCNRMFEQWLLRQPRGGRDDA